MEMSFPTPSSASNYEGLIHISADPSNLQGERAREKAFPGFWALSKSFSSGFRKQR